jgi:hypothetical protein
MRGGILQPFQLQARISGDPVIRLPLQRIGIASFEAIQDFHAPARIGDNHETPWLAEADGWSKAASLKKAIQDSIWNRVLLETPHITAPPKQVHQAGAKLLVEIRSGGSASGLAHPLLVQFSLTLRLARGAAIRRLVKEGKPYRLELPGLFCKVSRVWM